MVHAAAALSSEVVIKEIVLISYSEICIYVILGDLIILLINDESMIYMFWILVDKIIAGFASGYCIDICGNIYDTLIF
jgi:hypothetical protein